VLFLRLHRLRHENGCDNKEYFNRLLHSHPMIDYVVPLLFLISRQRS
jgi:hypothetical protein